MNTGSNFLCTPGLLIFSFCLVNSPLPKLFTFHRESQRRGRENAVKTSV